MSNMTLEELASHFTGAKRTGRNSFQCKCPAHDDKKASLTITEEKGKLLLHCHADCKTEEVLAAVGLNFKDISDYQEPDWRKKLEYFYKKKIETVYDYKTEKGEYLYSKVRFEGKVIRNVTIDYENDTFVSKIDKKKQTLYKLPEVIKAVKTRKPIFIVEGEKDVETLRKLGYVATTSGAVDTWNKKFAQYFIGANVVIMPDNDKPGEELKNKIIRDLRHYAHSIRCVKTSETLKGDVSDYIIKEKHTKEELEKLIRSAEPLYAEWVYMRGKGENKTQHINAGILVENLSESMNYLIVRRPDEEKDDFYMYENGVYNKCNRNQVKSYIMKYIPMSLVSDNLLNNVYNMLLCQGSKICSFNELDAEEKYINFRNGLYNLSTRKLEEHTPSVYSTTQIACEYNPSNHYKPTFNKYINDLCTDEEGEMDESKKAVLQEYGGLLLSNVNVYRTKLCLVLWSLLGNTGKSQFIKLLSELLGENKIVNIPIQNMNEQSKFALGSIPGSRIICVGDQTSSEIKDSSIFKQLTGGDSIQFEKKTKQPFNFTYPGGIIIACNNLPTFTDDKGGHLFERLCVVPCTNTIDQERRDSQLLDKILKEKEAVFNWFLEGLHRLINNHYKVTKSEACEKALNEYREKLDTVYRFLSEFYIVTGNNYDMVKKTEFENAYIKWCEKNEYKHVNKQNIKDRMESNGCRVKKARYKEHAGVMVYCNVKEKDTEFQEVEKVRQELEEQGNYETLSIPFE